VNIPAGTTNNYLASSSEYILFRVGWSDPEQQSCNAFASNTTTTITVDGRSVTFVALPCQLIPVGGQPANLVGQWFTDRRYLSPPLARGTHTASARIVYNAAVPAACANNSTDTPQCAVRAGTVQSFKKTVTVS
jgi:hypothetical protein